MLYKTVDHSNMYFDMRPQKLAKDKRCIKKYIENTQALTWYCYTFSDITARVAHVL